jgi:chorismate mutase
MSSTPSDLKGLRRRLDEIDDRLQDLLIERAEVVSMVAASKKEDDLPAFQPAREAEIIRRLVGRHHGAFPLASLVRMWREMLAATVKLQSPFSVAVFASTNREGYWDLARDHYGSDTPMMAHHAVDRVIRAVACGEASVGVLPMPQADDPDPWWPQLLSTAENVPQVIARLPFGARGNARSEGTEALAIGRSRPQESGLDRTLLAIECAPEITHSRILKVLSVVKLTCTLFASSEPGSPANLIEVDGFVPMSDRRLNDFREGLGRALTRLQPLGGYAVPLSVMALTTKG